MYICIYMYIYIYIYIIMKTFIGLFFSLCVTHILFLFYPFEWHRPSVYNSNLTQPMNLTHSHFN